MKIIDANGSESNDMRDLIFDGAIGESEGLKYEIPKPDKYILEYQIGETVFRRIIITKDSLEIIDGGLKVVGGDIKVEFGDHDV